MLRSFALGARFRGFGSDLSLPLECAFDFLKLRHLTHSLASGCASLGEAALLASDARQTQRMRSVALRLRFARKTLALTRHFVARSRFAFRCGPAGAERKPCGLQNLLRSEDWLLQLWIG